MSRPIRKFTEMIGLLSKGRFEEKLDEALAEALTTLSALPNESGKASISLTINIAYDSGRLDIKPTVKSKLPEGKAFTGTPFWEADGALSVQHPSQLDMLAPTEVSTRRDRTA